LVFILEAEDRLEDLTIGAIGRTRPLKMPPMLGAIITDEGRIEPIQRRIGLATLAAKRRLDAHRLGLVAFLPRKDQIQGAFTPVPCAVSGCTEG
jgi:hypothetical protein